ncbi:MAG: HNH endonuclease signature motif containing protein [Elstera sp.]
MARDKVDANARTRKAGLTQERLKSLLSYDPCSGHFTWLVDRGMMRCKGRRAGTPDDTGYLIIRVDYVIYKAHRLAWFYMTGKWPKEYIDHINGDKADNRWVNLREANPAQNSINSRPRQNKTGFPGVSISSKNSFKAKIKVNNVSVYLGNFATAEEAHEAFKKSAASYHGSYRKPGEVRS